MELFRFLSFISFVLRKFTESVLRYSQKEPVFCFSPSRVTLLACVTVKFVQKVISLVYNWISVLFMIFILWKYNAKLKLKLAHALTVPVHLERFNQPRIAFGRRGTKLLQKTQRLIHCNLEKHTRVPR